ncbi:hypothetical protein HYX00_00690 [Candidatus Woesearchaeota archaeon]|nr:hypothetical protein [Candidatus Woesearchaeota archaeon]
MLYLSILIPVLLLATSDERYTLLGGIVYAQWMIFGAFLMFFYLLFNFVYVIHMGFRKLLSKKDKKSSSNA